MPTQDGDHDMIVFYLRAAPQRLDVAGEGYQSSELWLRSQAAAVLLPRKYFFPKEKTDIMTPLVKGRINDIQSSL